MTDVLGYQLAVGVPVDLSLVKQECAKSVGAVHLNGECFWKSLKGGRRESRVFAFCDHAPILPNVDGLKLGIAEQGHREFGRCIDRKFGKHRLNQFSPLHERQSDQTRF